MAKGKKKDELEIIPGVGPSIAAELHMISKAEMVELERLRSKTNMRVCLLKGASVARA
jgi:glycerol-3-phosphate responsive antiterminator